MIEIQAKLLRGPVYFCEETIQCLITLRNIPREKNNKFALTQRSDNEDDNFGDIGDEPIDQDGSSSLSVERLCWANVQLHCFCLVDEQQVSFEKISETSRHGEIRSSSGLKWGKRSSIALETYASNDTSFHECLLRGEKGTVVYCSNPKILFCDLQLALNECQTFVYTETLPSQMNPSYSSSRLKYHYKLTIGAQRIGSPIHLLKIPIRILTFADDIQRLETNRNGLDNIQLDLQSLNSSLAIDDESRDDSSPLDMMLHRIEYQTCHRTPHNFNITNSFGRVAKFYIFKTCYRLGEDIVGVFNFTEGTVPCIRFSVALQTEEIIAEAYRVGSNSKTSLVTSLSKFQECTFNTAQSQMVLTIPLTATPSFSNAIVSLEWKLHFRFMISQNSEQANPIVYNETEDGIQQVAPRRLNVQTMTWDFPIKVLPTHPAHVVKGFQMASIGTLEI